MVLYVDGNDSAFETLLNRHKQSLYSYILHMMRDSSLADDIFQETFIKAIITIKEGKYRESGKFKAWIMRIAHNLMIDYFRWQSNEKTISNDGYEYDLLNNPALCDETVEDKMVKTQLLSDVQKLLSLLPDSQREVLEMRYYKSFSFKEIADETGVSINTALGRMRYAIINIRKLAFEKRLVLTLS